MADNLGASLEAWHHWSERLQLAEHLLPVVANPDVPISPDSKMKALGKTPSVKNFRGEVAGFPRWVENRSTFKQIAKWELEPDYGICVQSRHGGVQAFDIDVPSLKKARRIVEAIEGGLPLHFFDKRSREGTGKVLLPFQCEEPITKRVLQVDGGMIEVLGEGQQWIAESSYIKDGKLDGRYLWRSGWPTDFPVLTVKELDEVCGTLEMLFGEGEWSIARQRREGSGVDTTPRPGGDEVSNWLLAQGRVLDESRDGDLYIACPWIERHSMDSGVSETRYSPPGNGYEQGHFKCLHAGCAGKSDAEFLEAMGWSPDVSDAPELPEVAEPEGGDSGQTPAIPAPRYITNKKGEKEARQYNHELFLRDTEAVGLETSWDDYTAQIVWRRAGGGAVWRPFGDEHYSAIVRAMDRNGFVVQQPSTVRPAVYAHAIKHRVDTLADWVEALPEWDGVERVERFWIDYAGAADTPYVRAVGLYSWTAQAGRALDAGCQADMVPILVSKQGTRKTSLVRAIAPGEDQFVEINLMDRDDDTTRKMRGKSVVELGELRGMHSRAKEDIKAFVTRRTEEWVPKYQEFAKQFKRRFVFYGTTNKDDFLADETGERRYLPFDVGEDMQLDVEGVVRDREQLWAEAVALWRDGGIRWQDAERLAAGEHEKFKDIDPWTPIARRWLLEDDPLNGGAPVDRPFSWGTDDVLVGAIGLASKHIGRGEQTRLGKLLLGIKGMEKKKIKGVGWRYHISREALLAGDDADDLLE